jgi:ABC-type antimicrobial peptide transport system permease subunit
MGSNRKQLIAQFLGENLLLTCFALVIGLLIAFLLVPAYSSMWPFLEIELDLFENFELLGFLLLLLGFTGVIAGSYPALYVSAFQPSSILRSTLKFGGTNSFTRILLTLQYAISLIAIISGFIFAQNAEYQRDYDMGFDIESIVYAYVGDGNRYDQFRNEISGNPLIKEFAGSTHCVSNSWYTDPIKYESSELDVSILDIGENYLNTIDATILEGRDFIKDSKNDVENSVIINQELARIMGWDEPIGKRIILKDTIELYVVGVVKNIYIDGELWDPLDPMLMRYTMPENYRFLSVKTDLEHIMEVHEFMKAKWKTLFPDELHTVRYMDRTRADSAEVNNNIKIIFVFLGIVATILSAIGLFSLVSLNVIKKMKEIGVRKVLGASLPNIVHNISREFLIIFLIASVIGSVAAYFLAEALMASIWTYYVPIGVIAFVISIALLLLISSITISGKVLHAATMNPAYTLRDE